MKRQSWLASVNRVSPQFCRLIARVGHGHACRPMTNLELAQVSGLSPQTIYLLSRRSTWNTTSVEVMWRFTMACGVDIRCPKKAIRDFARCHLTYLQKKLNPRQNALYKRLLAGNK